MRKSLFSWFLAVATLVGTFAGVRADDEEKVPLDKVPKSVMETVKKRFAGCELIGASKETENGKTAFEITLKFEGAKMDVSLSTEGELQGIEKQIAYKSLPQAVAKTVESTYPNATIKMVEELIKVKDGSEKVEGYEIQLVTADKKTKVEVVLSPEGKVTREEKKTVAKKDKEEDKN